MAMVLGSENTAGHFGFIFVPKLNMLKMVLWNLGQLGNHPDKFFQPPKQDGYMKTLWGITSGVKKTSPLKPAL